VKFLQDLGLLEVSQNLEEVDVVDPGLDREPGAARQGKRDNAIYRGLRTFASKKIKHQCNRV
jgi:hypothetical protein